jgi:hypothetical protein
MELTSLLFIQDNGEALGYHASSCTRDTRSWLARSLTFLPPGLAPAGSIAVVPAGSFVAGRWQGGTDVLHVLLELSLVARVAAESFRVRFDPGGCATARWLDGA